MSDLTIQLLRLINEGKTLNEISEILNISHKKIFNYLTMIKNTGYDFKRNYYSNGDIIYTPEVRYNVPASNEVNLLMSQNDETLRAVVISDTHIGSEKERLDLLEDTYNSVSYTHLDVYKRQLVEMLLHHVLDMKDILLVYVYRLMRK